MARPEHVIRLAQLKLVRDSAELEFEIRDGAPGWFYGVYQAFRNRAAEALAGMAFVDPNDARAIELMQIDIRVFDVFVEETRAFLNQGRTIDAEITDADRQEALDMLLGQGDIAQAVDLGLIAAETEDG